MLDELPPGDKESWLDEPGWHRAKIKVVFDPLLPADFLPRLIVRLQNLYARGWEDGALLERKGQDGKSASRAIVHQKRRVRDRQLEIECSGNYPELLQGQIYHVLECLLEEGYHKISVEATVSCPLSGS